jgi:hypothetical protein
MKDRYKETRLVVLKCPEDVAEELSVLSRFNAVSRTEFVVTSVDLLLERLCSVCPELADLPPAPLRTRNRVADDAESEYPDDDSELVLMAAEDEE